jgi:hypothetical protein
LITRGVYNSHRLASTSPPIAYPTRCRAVIGVEIIGDAIKTADVDTMTDSLSPPIKTAIGVNDYKVNRLVNIEKGAALPPTIYSLRMANAAYDVLFRAYGITRLRDYG